MANKSRGEIELQLNGGEPLIWRLRWKDIAEIEHALEQLEHKKVAWFQFRSRLAEWTVRELALVVWAGLRHTGKFSSPDDILELAEDFTIQDSFISQMAELVMSAVPEDTKKKLERAQPTTTSPTGQ